MTETAIGGSNIAFQPTLWTTVLRAKGGDGGIATATLGRLIERYWKPLYFFVRRHGHDVEAAKDLTQSFFERALERDFLQNVSPAKGRFRTWLLKAMSHFLSDERERARAAKRGGGRAPLDVELVEHQVAACTDPPDRAFHRAWATETLERSLARLKEEWTAKGRSEKFPMLVRHLSGDSETYEGSARRLGIAIHEVKNLLRAMRLRLREVLREEVAPSVENPAEADAELQELFSALG